jgi:hypothetical protein
MAEAARHALHVARDVHVQHLPAPALNTTHHFGIGVHKRPREKALRR